MSLSSMQQLTKKRQRGENWLEEDKIILKELVRERVSVLENKNTDTNSNSMKVAAWNGLRESFNCMCNGAPRSVLQLKAQWGLLKMKAKKTKAEERKELLKTGGGPPPVIQGNSSDDISSWLPNEFVTDTNEFDSDSINQIIVRPPPPLPPEIIKEVIVVTPPNPPADEIINEMPVVEPHHPEAGHTGSSGPQQKKTIKKKKKVLAVCRTPAEQIAEFEIQCRKELHAIQMENERQRNKNLKIKEMILKKKLNYNKPESI